MLPTRSLNYLGAGLATAATRRATRRCRRCCPHPAGTELQRAAEFLDRSAPGKHSGYPLALQPAPPLLLLPPPAVATRRRGSAPPSLVPRAAAGCGAPPTSPPQLSPSGAATQGGDSCNADAEVSALLSLLLPQQRQGPQPPPPPAEEPAEVAQCCNGVPPLWAAPAEEAAPVLKTVAPPQAAPAGTSAEQRRSQAKVLSWLSGSHASDAARTTHAKAPAAHYGWKARAFQPIGTARAPPAGAAQAAMPAPLLRSRAAVAPAGYGSQLQLATQPRRLTLVRPSCPGCGRSDAECCCAGARGSPLRLLRPRQPQASSAIPARGYARCTQARQQQQAPLTAPPGPAAVTIGSIQTAFFGGGGGENAAAAAWLQAPRALLAPPLAIASCPGPAAGCGSLPSDNVWSAYLAGRRAATDCAGKRCCSHNQYACRPLLWHSTCTCHVW